MKRVIFLIIMVYAIHLQGQTVKHHSYTTYYDASKGEPDSVSWQLTPAMVSCTNPGRQDMFKQDPDIPGSTKPQDYKGSGYDQGHMFPFADAECDATDRFECFYMSNMLPQLHALNAGD